MKQPTDPTRDNGNSHELQSDGWPHEGWGEPEQPAFTGRHWVSRRSQPDDLFVATWSDRGFWLGFGAQPAEFGKTHLYHGRARTPREIAAAVTDAHRAGYLAGRASAQHDTAAKARRHDVRS